MPGTGPEMSATLAIVIVLSVTPVWFLKPAQLPALVPPVAEFTPVPWAAPPPVVPPAAVLVPLVDHPGGLTVLLTQRAEALRRHGGQISFPGGRIEAGDAGPLAAALRETHEEIGLEPARVHPLGYLPDHVIASGFRVTPVVALVDPGFSLSLDSREVRDTFEVPLAHVFDAHNHRSRVRRFGDEDVELYDIPYGDRHIWGATAGMLMTFYGLVTGAAR